MVSIDTIVSTETIVLWLAPFGWSFIHCEARWHCAGIAREVFH